MNCFMVQEHPAQGGGNRVSRPMITVRRDLAIGDILCSTIVADKLAAQGYRVRMLCHSVAHPMLRRCGGVAEFDAPGRHYSQVTLNGAYEGREDKTSLHFHRAFIEKANSDLAPTGINLGPATNCKPRLRVRERERELATSRLSSHPKPWVFICPRSETYPMRQVPDATWVKIAARLPGTKFWIGVHPAPAGIVDLRVSQFDTLIVLLSAADLLLTVDTGPMHVAAALNVPIVVAYQSSSPDLHLGDQTDYIAVKTDLECLNCQKTLCPINPVTPPCQTVDLENMISWANARLCGGQKGIISAVIPIYQPDVKILNRCLESVLPQVSEVIITRAREGIVPHGTLSDSKIRHVTAPGTKIGFGRNVNHGVRWTNGRYVLILNDDCFLDPDAVSRLVEEMKPGVGMVSHLLHYPDGRIYHAGVFRNPGDKDWHHIDHLKFLPTFDKPTELENVCGTSILVRREMHYAIGGFDEDFFLYSEDNDYAMRCRQNGWKVMFTPYAKGVHLSHQSSEKLGDVNAIIRQSNALFHRKWAPYLAHNRDRVPGNFDYLKTT